jgi:hypothetical protein
MSSSSELLDLLSTLRARRQGLASELDDVDGDISAVERTLALTRGEELEPSTEVTHGTNGSYDGLAGKSQLEAIVTLATRNNGFVRVSEAKRMLIETRLTKVGSARKAYSVATSNLVRSKRFEWVAPGTYRLKPELTPAQEAAALLESEFGDAASSRSLVNGHASIPA